MASIDCRATGFRVRWRDPNGAARSRQCPDRTTARRVRTDVERTVAEGRRWEPRCSRAKPDLEEILTAYIRDRVRVLAPGTAERYARSLEVFLRWLRASRRRPRLLDPALLSRSLLAEFYEHLAGDGRHGRARRDSTRRKVTEVVQLAWAWAANDDEWTAFVPPARTLEMRPRQSVATVAPTWDEMDRVIAAFPKDSWHRRVAVILRFTGLRVQQAMMLTWSDVDVHDGTLRIRPELGKSRQEKRGRIIPVSPHLLTQLKRWGAREGFLIKTKLKGDRERIARPKSMERAWARAGIRPEVWKGRPHHAFRKGFVSGLRRAGADGDAVEYLVGHSLGLRGVYLDPDALLLREAVAKVPSLGRRRQRRRSDPPRPLPG